MIKMKDRIKTIVSFARPHKYKFMVLFICVIITTFSGSIYPYIFGRLVDEVFYEKNLSLFYQIVILYGCVFLFNQALHFILNLFWAKLMTRFLFDIRIKIFSKVLSLPGIKLSSIQSGDILFRMGHDVEQFMNYIHWNTFYLIARITNLALSIGFLSAIYWPFALFAIIATPVVVYVSKSFSKKIKTIHKIKVGESGFLSSWLFEIIKGMQEIKLLSALKGVLSDYVGYTIKITRLHIKESVLQVVSDRVNSGISLVWQLILYSVSAILVINGNITLGGFTACVSYFGKCIGSFNALNNHLTAIPENIVSIDRVSDILNEESEKDEGDEIEIRKGDIEFRDIHFSYTEELEVLKGLNFKIRQGERVALVGVGLIVINKGVDEIQSAVLLHQVEERVQAAEGVPQGEDGVDRTFRSVNLQVVCTIAAIGIGE